MRILLCNDDGPDAEGVRCLQQRLSALGETWAITPDRERSATSHALSIRESLQLKEVGHRRFTLSGYPADCANVGLHSGRFPRFDLVVSGINHGPNLGDDVHYSGTVAAARQGAVHSLHSIAISFPDYNPQASAERPAQWFAGWLQRNLDRLHAGIVYNINYPDEQAGAEGFPEERWTYQGRRTYRDEYEILEEGNGEALLRMRTTEFGHVREDRSDFEAVIDGCISITPLSTYTTHIRELKRWF
ncbi:MAG: 5'/3'-nucleotidase SurE [Leptospirales bacterium]|nr:5'/3'-nucleotidase SurE [Leptospirales bacterium]